MVRINFKVKLKLNYSTDESFWGKKAKGIGPACAIGHSLLGLFKLFIFKYIIFFDKISVTHNRIHQSVSTRH